MEDIDVRHDELKTLIESVGKQNPSGGQWIAAEASIKRLMLRSLEDSLADCITSLNSGLRVLGNTIEQSTSKSASSVEDLRKSLQEAASSSERHAASLKNATWAYAAATVALVLVTFAQLLTLILGQR
jgi:hypothetical protein